MRPAHAEISLAALSANLDVARRLAGTAEVTAVVKANGYGHGAVRILPALADAKRLAVAAIEEAVILREAGARQPILLLEGVFEENELALCDRLGFEIGIHEPGQIAMLERASLTRALPVWLKLDSGMGRLGVRPDAFAAAHARLLDCRNTASITLMSHLASADDPGSSQTRAQLDIVERVFASLPGDRSLANSAGLMSWPEARADIVRPGIMLYGVTPMAGRTGVEDGLTPVMTLGTGLIAVKELQPGDTVGYAASWTAGKRHRIGIAAIGYGDGYPRHAPTGTPVLVDGKRTRLVGRVSMDMIAIDLDGFGEATGVGAPVTLWGEGLPVEEVAEAAGTIGYELLCGVTARVPFRVIA